MTENDVKSSGELERLVSELRSLSGDIESCAVISNDGKLLYSSHPEGVDRERARAMLSALVGLSERMAREDGKEHTTQVRVKTGSGHFLMARLENGGAIASTTGTDARVGLVLYDMRNARSGVEKAMSGEGN
ncbi:MAG: roadblock/LC7 domain-containing protein [Actinomycetota bacterium]|nr:roadblock/LC7 domain-containing protein [Actinomycetota bacterium]